MYKKIIENILKVNYCIELLWKIGTILYKKINVNKNSDVIYKKEF